MTPEGRVKAAIRRYLDEIGAWYFMPVPIGSGRAGIPDFVGCLDGLFFAIEAKAPGRLSGTSVSQKREIAAILSVNGLAFVADSVETVMEKFNAEIIRARTQDQEGVQRTPGRDEEARRAE